MQDRVLEVGVLLQPRIIIDVGLGVWIVWNRQHLGDALPACCAGLRRLFQHWIDSTPKLMGAIDEASWQSRLSRFSGC